MSRLLSFMTKAQSCASKSRSMIGMLLIAALWTLATPSVIAQTQQYWDGAGASNNGTVDGGPGTWNGTNSNWTNSTGGPNGVWASGSVAIFQGTTGGGVSVGTAQNISGLTFNNTASYTLTGSALTGSSGSQIAVQLAATTIYLSNPLAGTSFSKTGPGTFSMSGTNTFSGLFTVQEGGLALSGSNANQTTVWATLGFSNASPTLSASYTLVDTTTVGNSALVLLKEVRNVTTGGAWGTSNQARSGQVLEYRVTYTNTTTSPMTKVMIGDSAPAYTVFQSAAAGTVPGDLGACTMNTPANPAPAAAVDCATVQPVGGTGAIRWLFDGRLNPGASGDVGFRVKVE